MPIFRLSKASFDRLGAQWEPEVLRGFLQSVQTIKDSASASAIAAAIEAGQVDRAVELVRLGENSFAPLMTSIQQAYAAGGGAALSTLPRDLMRGPDGGRLNVFFNPGSPRAAQWARETNRRLIVEIVDDQRAAIRHAVGAGLDAGRNPRAVALDIVGRMQGGRRMGGIVGLHSQFAGYVENARAELSDPAAMANYFTRQARDRRFDGIVRRALKNGRAVSQRDIDRIIARYADRLLKVRGDAIGRTEALTALSAGQNEGIEQLIETGQVSRDQVTIKWRATLDGRTRDIHSAMHNMTVKQGEPFNSPTGARLRHPRDTSLGAGGEDVINCRCYGETRIDYISRRGN